MLFDFDAIEKALLKHSGNCVEFYRGAQLITKSFIEVRADVLATVDFLSNAGLKPGERVGILGGNNYEWMLVDLGCLAGGWTSVVFHNNAAETPVATLFERYSLRLLVTTEQYRWDVSRDGHTVTFSDIEQHLSRRRTGHEGQALYNAPSNHFTVYFTSGTTGTPKALAFSRRSCGEYLDHVQQLFTFFPDDKIILFLPFSALLERLHMYTAIIVGFNILIVAIENVAKSLRADRPTILVGVPYLFESIWSVFRRRVDENPRLKLLFGLYSRSRKWLPASLDRQLQRKLFKEVHAFWGGRMRLMLSGTAPIKRAVLEFHESTGVPILEGYGISEIGMVSVNTLKRRRTGSVGRPFPGREVVIGDGGEILVRSQHPFSTGYLEEGCPEQKRFRPDGFYETGDLGHIDGEGFLYITGRSKEIIVLSNGKKVSPGIIEDKIGSINGISQAAIFGDRRPYLVGVLVQTNGGANESSIRAELQRINRDLPPFMRVRDIVITDQRFTVDNKCLTPTMKLNRPVIWETFGDRIGRLYVNS